MTSPTTMTDKNNALVVTVTVASPDADEVYSCVYVGQVLQCLARFFIEHDDLFKESHGMPHAQAVYHHACQAIACHQPPLSSTTATEIKVAALLHDVDDEKYFPEHHRRDGDDNNNSNSNNSSSNTKYHNARAIMEEANVPEASCEQILTMIDLVSCSQNGNSVPDWVRSENKFHMLMPRWSDRLEAVGAAGVVRCYRYNLEKGLPLCSENSPRATTVEQVWAMATPERFEAYQSGGGGGGGCSNKLSLGDDMISHYYDKLLHVARPPPDIVRNAYLTAKAAESSRELVEVCLRFGRTGKVDEEYIQDLAKPNANEKVSELFSRGSVDMVEVRNNAKSGQT